MQEAHVNKRYIPSSRFTRYNYTTIGPSDRDSNLKEIFYLFNIQCIHSEKKIEEI